MWTWAGLSGPTWLPEPSGPREYRPRSTPGLLYSPTPLLLPEPSGPREYRPRSTPLLYSPTPLLLPEPSGPREPGPGPHPWAYSPTPLLLPEPSGPREPGPGPQYTLLLPSYSLSQVGPESPAQVHTRLLLSYSPPTP